MERLILLKSAQRYVKNLILLTEAGEGAAAAALFLFGLMDSHSGENDRRADDDNYYEGSSIHPLLEKKIGQQGDNPGKDALEHHHEDGPFAAEFPADGCNRGHARCVKQAEHHHRCG